MTDASEPSPQRCLPSVDQAVRELGDIDLPRPAVAAVVRRELQAMRDRLAGAEPGAMPGESRPAAMRQIRLACDDLLRCRVQPVINGTGIIIHTNLGRSPLGAAAANAVADAALNYNNLEYNLSTGARGGRANYLEHNLAILCGAEAAAVVNNCAAALVLILRGLAGTPPRTNVVISRGELVQIGGGFRVPDILRAAGAALCEVGTTNRTTIQDYQSAIDDRTALLLRVHPSNFYMEGFVASPASAEIAALARSAGVPFVCDIGSGAPFPTESLGQEHEPTPAEAIAQGADLICFSGDKLFGGPQAGIIAGREALVTALKKEPLFRALRCGKLILAALQATVDLILSRQPDEIPIRAMMALPIEGLRRRAESIAASLSHRPLQAHVVSCESQVGGGSLPRTTLASVGLGFEPEKLAPDVLAARVRMGTPPVIGVISAGSFRIDLRTVFPRQDEALVAALRTAHA